MKLFCVFMNSICRDESRYVYETCESDIGIPDFHRIPKVDRLSTRPPGFRVSHI